MSPTLKNPQPLSPWWRHAVILVLIFGFSLLTWVTVKAYRGAPPDPGPHCGCFRPGPDHRR